MDEKTLIEARKTAEKAVNDMTDPDLRIKAFEVILQKLLATGDEIVSHAPIRRKTKKPTHSAEGTTNGLDLNSKRGRIRQIRDGGFFQQPRTIAEVRAELRNRGWVYPLTSLSGPLQKLVQHGELRRTIANDGRRKIYNYVNP